jgi:hypothetical protein
MKNLFFFILLMLVGFSCEKPPVDDRPKGLLPPAKMMALLKDIHHEEAALNLSGIRQDSAASFFKFIEKDLFKKHGVDSLQVMKSLEYYNQHIELLDSMYRAMGGGPASPVQP